LDRGWRFKAKDAAKWVEPFGTDYWWDISSFLGGYKTSTEALSLISFKISVSFLLFNRVSNSARASLIVEPSRLEMDEPLPNWELLRDLAGRSGGKFFNLPQVGGLADAIIQDTGGVVTHVELGTEKSWKLYLAIIVLFTLEWALRRRIFVV